MKRLSLAALALLVSPALAQTAENPPPASPVRFVERPNGDDFAREYPWRALNEEVEGRVVLDCRVIAQGKLACGVFSQEPAGYGFGEAALRMSPLFRVEAVNGDLASVQGARVRVPIRFELGEMPQGARAVARGGVIKR